LVLAALPNTKTPSLCRALEQSNRSGSGGGSRIKRAAAQVHRLGLRQLGVASVGGVRSAQPRSLSFSAQRQRRYVHRQTNPLWWCSRPSKTRLRLCAGLWSWLRLLNAPVSCLRCLPRANPLPNPSLEGTATGKPAWPRGARCLSSASRPSRLPGVRPSAQTLGSRPSRFGARCAAEYQMSSLLAVFESGASNQAAAVVHASRGPPLRFIVLRLGSLDTVGFAELEPQPRLLSWLCNSGSCGVMFVAKPTRFGGALAQAKSGGCSS